MPIFKYQYSDGKKDTLLTSNSLDGLFKKTKAFFIENKITFNEHSLRVTLRKKNSRTSIKGKRRLGEVINGAKALIKRFTTAPVSNEEIIRRSDICSNCDWRSDTSDCMACGGAKRASNMVNDMKSARGLEIEIPAQVKNKYCGVCDCALALMIPTNYEDLKPEDPEKNALRPDFCWLKRQNIQ